MLFVPALVILLDVALPGIGIDAPHSRLLGLASIVTTSIAHLVPALVLAPITSLSLSLVAVRSLTLLLPCTGRLLVLVTDLAREVRLNGRG